ncbi:MAG: SusD/RagB family nutrient-binding outer membrane lipoprotein [Tannerellaceae bacterium]
MKKIVYIGLISGLLATTACSDYLDINTNPNYPVEASPSTLLPSGIAAVASATGGIYELYGGMWSQQYTQGHSSNQYNTLVNYTITNASDSRLWTIPYSHALPDLDLVVKGAEAAKEWNYWVMGKTMTVFMYHVLVDSYGSIPFTEALMGNENTTPKYDESKAVVYPGMLAMLDEVIAKKAEATAAGLPAISKSDFVFAGNVNHWIRFAKSLKLKLMLRDFEANKAAIKALLDEGDLLTVDAKMDCFQDLENKSNPLYENDRRKLNTSNNIRACVTVCDYMKKFKDPRLNDFFNKNQDGKGETTALKYGDRPNSSILTTKMVSIAKLTPLDAVYFMSAAEVAFIQAECYARLGDAAKAKTAYDKGVSLAFDRWGHDASTFIADGGAYVFNAKDQSTMLTSILTQKWIASTRSQAWDAWFDINRTGIPVLGTRHVDEPNYVWGQLTPCIGSALAPGEYPRRLLYPKSSSDYNPNCPAVVPIQEKQWWHK